MSNKKTAVVIPTYNNPATIAKVAQDVLDHHFDLIIVDDGSDTPVSTLVENSVPIVTHPRNLGKGAAILSGAQKAKELGFDYFVSMDGDGQHLASQITKLEQAISESDQIVIGSRNFNIENIPTISKVGRGYHNFWIRLNTNYKINDSLSGFRLYPTSIVDLGISSRRFDFEVEVLVRHYWKHRKVSDKVVECYYPTAEERISHFDNVNDTIAITLLHLKFFVLRFILFKGRQFWK